MSGLCFYRLDSFFNSGEIDSQYRKVKFFILMLFPLLASEEEFPPLNSHKKVEKYCSPIIDKLNNQDEVIEIFLAAINIINSSGVDIEDKQQIKSKTMTEKILISYNNRVQN